MSRDAVDLMPPRVAIVDDERPVHASIRLRLGKDYELVSFYDARHALDAVAHEKFDLCLVDIHMPHMNGLAFVEAATKSDPALGCVVLSAFDTDENLRRTIPLHVYDFIPKPLPERAGFEARLPEWIARTRQRRRDHSLAHTADKIDQSLQAARLDREVELVASESARDALLQTANLLTTIHAHLVTASNLVAARVKTDPSAVHLLRNLDMGLKTAEAAVSVAEGFFDSAYGNRDSSPALLDASLRHAGSIASRMCRAEETRKTVDLPAVIDQLPVYGLTGIDLLLMLVPAIAIAVSVAEAGTTVSVRCEPVSRLEAASKDTRFREFLWLNRRNAASSKPGVLVEIAAPAAPFSRAQAESWLRGDHAPLATVTARGLVTGIQKCRGLLALAVAPRAIQFRLLLALPA